ncbi:MAG: protein phosphatase 2C domain-containing protein [Hydrogenobacter sp.]
MRLQIAGKTHRGLIRQNNEDFYLVYTKGDSKTTLAVVADGVGGNKGGDVASRLAVETIVDFYKKNSKTNILKEAFLRANAVILEKARIMGLDGMATTCTAVLIEAGRMQLAHAGDSRAYLLRRGDLVRLTSDHTLPGTNMLLNALGIKGDLYVEEHTLTIYEGDTILLCTDGLYRYFQSEELEEDLKSKMSPQEIIDSLIEKALKAGGADNITAILIQVK